jgi:hypothetical protein
MNIKFKVANVLSLKEKLVITIFGSYDLDAMARLNKLKKCMIDKGYTRCNIVMDYAFPVKRRGETDNQYFLRKSIHWLERSDACFFIFFDDCRNDGVVLELKHTCDFLHDKLETCLVALESKRLGVTSRLVQGTIDNLEMQRKLNQRRFEDDEQLCKFCGGATISFLKKLRYLLQNR